MLPCLCDCQMFSRAGSLGQHPRADLARQPTSSAPSNCASTRRFNCSSNGSDEDGNRSLARCASLARNSGVALLKSVDNVIAQHDITTVIKDIELQRVEIGGVNAAA